MAKSEKATLYKTKVANKINQWGYASIFNTKKEREQKHYWVELYIINKKLVGKDFDKQIKDMSKYGKLGLTYICAGVGLSIDSAYNNLLKKVDLINSKMNTIKDKMND